MLVYRVLRMALPSKSAIRPSKVKQSKVTAAVEKVKNVPLKGFLKASAVFIALTLLGLLVFQSRERRRYDRCYDHIAELIENEAKSDSRKSSKK